MTEWSIVPDSNMQGASIFKCGASLHVAKIAKAIFPQGADCADWRSQPSRCVQHKSFAKQKLLGSIKMREHFYPQGENSADFAKAKPSERVQIRCIGCDENLFTRRDDRVVDCA